jgi:hypothetical protein
MSANWLAELDNLPPKHTHTGPRTPPAHLVHWAEGVQVGELRPRDRDHLCGCIELHGAAAQWDHGVGQGQVTILKALQVTQHLMLTV